MSSPISCDLSKLDDAARQREQQLLAEFVGMARRAEIEETESGFRFATPTDPQTLARLGEFIALERLCCPFLDFSLEVSQRGAMLHVHGPAAAKAFIGQLLGQSSWE
jgi:hypothetical protein